MESSPHGRRLGALNNQARHFEEQQTISVRSRPLSMNTAAFQQSTIKQERSPTRPLSASARIQDRVSGGALDPLGLTIWHEPSTSPVADIVLLHGLGGGSRHTWSYDDFPNTFWPLDWLPSEPALKNARISTFGYHSYLTSSDPDRLFDISDFAKALLAQLRFGTGTGGRSLDVGRTPLIFVAHSTGGLVAKKAYILAKSNNNAAYIDIADAISAFVFLSTPHKGNMLTNVLNNILSTCVLGWIPDEYGACLGKHVPDFETINDQFRDLAPLIEIVSFYERRNTALSSGKEILVLREDLATLGHPRETAIPLDADHHTVAKYVSSTDSNYTTVRDTLKYLVDKFKPRQKPSGPEDVQGQLSQVQGLLEDAEAPEDDLTTLTDKRVQGSCEWILRDVRMRSFAEADQPSPQCLWCYGNPGSGKSVLAASVIEKLRDESLPIAYYFFRSGDHVKNNLTTFLVSVAAQLAEELPEYRRKLCKLAESGFSVSRAKHKVLWRKLFMSALADAGIRPPFFIVIDGLDELGAMKELLEKMFTELSGEHVPLRLLLVSRQTSDVLESMERLAQRLPLQTISLNDQTGDLELFVQEEMGTMYGNDPFRIRIQEELLAKAQGNFLWVHLVVQEIRQCVTEEQVEDALRSIPKELGPLYDRMDVQLADSLQSRPRDKALGHLILKWAACARSPLTLNELQSAIQPEFARIMDMRHTVQKLCRDFVTVDSKHHVSMMHTSTRDYILTNAHLNYYVEPHQTHQSLLGKCLGALHSHATNNRAPASRPDPFTAYAATSWPFHLVQSHAAGDQESLILLTKFMRSGVVLDWMLELAQKSSLRTLVEASRAITSFLKLVDKTDQTRSPLEHRLTDKDFLSAWAQDLIRVVGKFGVQITQHPQTLRSLVPEFCPRESMMHQQFAKGSASSLKVSGSGNQTWDDCFAKFTVADESFPHQIFCLGRYFAISSKESGIVHLYYATTCGEARSMRHDGPILRLCVDTNRSRIATYGFLHTKVWDVSTGTLMATIENPRSSKALDLCFSVGADGTTCLLSFSDDRAVRCCCLEALDIGWETIAQNIGHGLDHLHHANAPRVAQFSPDGVFLALSHRGAHPQVWNVSQRPPRFVAQCTNRAEAVPGHSQRHVNYVDAQAFTWNPISGHLLGTYNDGSVFKWHHKDGDFQLNSDNRCTHIKCAANGKHFATASGDGTLRIWDFDHFTPIYQLRYPASVQDIEISTNEARIYDIRDQYCNIWEPNALFRAMETDDHAADSCSTKDGSQPSLASDAVQEDFNLINAFAAHPTGPYYATGDEFGGICVSDLDGRCLSRIPGHAMSIEVLNWSPLDGGILATADLSRDIRISKHPTSQAQARCEGHSQVLRTFMEPKQVLQLLFSPDGTKLLVVLHEAVRIYSVLGASEPMTIPAPTKARWVLHPQDPSCALGIGSDSLKILPWDDPLICVTLRYDLGYPGLGTYNSRPTLHQDVRRPSHAYPASPSELEGKTNKALISPDGRLIVIEILWSTQQFRRRLQCLLIDATRIEAYRGGGDLPVSILPDDVAEALHASVGFASVQTPSNRSRFAASGPFMPANTNTNRPRPSFVHNPHAFVFVDHEFWLCSVVLGLGPNATRPIRRHFFIPRDWQNTECLQMAQVSQSGHFLCPRNGSVDIVSNGLLDTFID